MTAPHDRRGFLRGLATLPLIGGSVALIGQPSAVAAPATPGLLEAYKSWLHFEKRLLAWEMAADPFFQDRYRPLDGARDRVSISRAVRGAYFDFGGQHQDDTAPSSRAALVLTAVGCDWRPDDSEGGRHV